MMPGALDSILGPEAKALISEYGKPVQITRNPSSVANPGQGTVTAGTPLSETVIVTPPEDVSKELVDGSAVIASDMQVYLAAEGLGWTPTAASILNLLIDGVTWQCVAVRPVYSGINVCLWRLVLRA